METLVRSEAIRIVMADLIAGRQPYRLLTWRLLGACDAELLRRGFALQLDKLRSSLMVE
jgi:hypothetical protein